MDAFQKTDLALLRLLHENRDDYVPIGTIVLKVGREVGRPIIKEELEKYVKENLRAYVDDFFDDEWKLVDGVGKEVEEILQKALDKERSRQSPVTASKPPTRRDSSSNQATPLNLFDWQKEALSKWKSANYCGLIEAVTGTGKTHVGLAAIKELKSKHRVSPLVVVPSIAIMEQWEARLKQYFPDRSVACIGGGRNEDYSISPIACVAVINSLVTQSAAKLKRLLAHCRQGATRSLLIADECHHYADAPVFNRLLQYPFDYTLGLSATMPSYEIEGLGRVIYEYRFQKAHDDGLVPPFELINVGVHLTPHERDRYLELTEAINDSFSQVMKTYAAELQGISDDRLFVRLRQLMGKIGEGKEPMIERLMVQLFKRASIYYMAHHKMTAAENLTRKLVMEAGKKVIVFFERIASADSANEEIPRQAARKLQKQLIQTGSLWCKVYHSGLNPKERKEVLEAFRQRGPSALLVCRSLDEGVDIPDVDAAILAASTQSKRQRIQRIGRTLRRGSGNKKPIITTLYAIGTSDANVTHEDHKEFKGVATIHEVEGRELMSTIDAVLSP